jgi:hypothetical protein
MTSSAILLVAYGNIQQDICTPIQRNNQRFLSNGENKKKYKSWQKMTLMFQ